MSDELVLTIDPPYIGSAVSPTVDITETTDDITVTITDFQGDHSYTIEKTDQAIADAEQAATNANNAASQATSTANAAAQYARDTADQAAQDAQATADAAAETAITAATSANTAAQAANSAASAANGAAQLATTAAGNADTKAALADSKAGLADSAATTANQAAQAAQSATADAQTATQAANTAAGTANTAASNADAKAALADTAATNADTATQAANTATTNATNAAQAANNAADVAIEAAEDMPKLVGTVDTAQTVADAWETTMEGATVYGKSVQDGTPTPDNPVPVQVVGGRNLIDETTKVVGSLNSNGTLNTSVTTRYTSDYLDVIAGLKYTLSSSNVACLVSWYQADGTHIRRDNNNTVTAWTLTAPDNASKARVAWDNTATFIQLEAGTTATPYTPYGCIGLQTGDTVTPIDLQGHTLASLPDGTRDVLRVDGAGRAWIEQNIEYVTFPATIGAQVNQVTVSGQNMTLFRVLLAQNNLPRYTENNISVARYASMSNQYGRQTSYARFDNGFTFNPQVGSGDEYPGAFDFVSATYTTLAEFRQSITDNPLIVAYPGEQQIIELGTITPPDIAPGDTLAIYASLDPDWQIEYEQDPNIVVTALQSSIAPVEGSTASANYSVGSYLIHANQLCRVTSAIATGEAIAPGTNCVACTVMGEVIRLTA